MMKLLFAIVSVGLFIFCANKDGAPQVQITKIRVINQTGERFTNVMLFSMKFQDLKPGDTSAYQVLDFDPLRDDSLIYCSIGNTNYARYLEIPTEGARDVSYIIDSIENRIIYISTVHGN